MHQLGAVNADELRENIKHILSARRRAYDAGIELLECDDVYANRIKSELERLILASHTSPFADSDEERAVDSEDVRMYFEMHRRIYLRSENIMMDLKKKSCQIILNPRIMATLPVKNAVAIRSVLV